MQYALLFPYTFIVVLLTGFFGLGYFPIKIENPYGTPVIEHISIADEIKKCEDWGGDFRLGTPFIEGRDHMIVALYGGYVFPPYKKLSDKWAIKCSKENTKVEELYQ